MFEIRTLTPIWTGDAEGKCTTIKETAIIGSMRWWYEAIVRGMGGYACDPTSDTSCKFNAEAYEEYKRHLKSNESKKLASNALEAGLKEVCPACKLFGCTGWKRRFKLETSVDANQIEPFNLITLDKNNSFNNWWLSKAFEKSIKSDNSKLTFGKFNLVITELAKSQNPSISSQIHSLLSIMSTMGAIGAKNQYGYGIFDLNDKRSTTESLKEINLFLEHFDFMQEISSTDFYSLDRFWCYEFSLAEDNKTVLKFRKANIIGKKSNSNQYIPVSFDIRYKLPGTEFGLRNNFSKQYGKQKTRQIFGTITETEKNGRIGSRIFVSHVFRKNNSTGYFLKIWGFTDEEVANFIESTTKDMFGLSSHEVVRNDIELKAFLDGARNDL
ncbi:type III-B CRISPR module RAMP protein Cmr1 [Methanomethylovorans sp.]|uniref:type III-B CRISPR module RAMP protein Cmr1 n=1 Tax=Methanomethylovorans sp. TaxID=2758717 RepID=UPI000ACBBEA0|nr:type III-B CRISPR module RAMP protein Cmr1 [Methanomethylovorans sp.]